MPPSKDRQLVKARGRTLSGSSVEKRRKYSESVGEGRESREVAGAPSTPADATPALLSPAETLAWQTPLNMAAGEKVACDKMEEEVREELFTVPGLVAAEGLVKEEVKEQLVVPQCSVEMAAHKQVTVASVKMEEEEEVEVKEEPLIFPDLEAEGESVKEEGSCGTWPDKVGAAQGEDQGHNSPPRQSPPMKEAAPTTRSRTLHSREKEIIYNVNRYFLAEKANGGPVIPFSDVIARTAKATNVSEATVRQICAEFSAAGRTQDSPEKPAKNSSATVKRLSSFDKHVLRRTVLGFYERNEFPTLFEAREELVEKGSFNGCLQTLRQVLLKMGFKYAKVDGCPFLMEKNDVVAARTRFLREMEQLKQSCQNFVYLDESWVTQYYTTEKCETEAASQQARGVKPHGRSGCRLIMLHAGTKDGFIDDAELVFQAKYDGDYRGQLTPALFEEWFRNQLLPNILPNSVIVMDDASYHCALVEKVPSLSWKKADMKDWLVKKGVELSDDLLKVELYELTKKFTDNKKYVIDTIGAEAGHRVVRLPPYHGQYNPMECIWAQVKSYIGKKNNFKMAYLKRLTKEALSSVTAQDWLQAVQRSEQLHEEDARLDIVVDRFMDSFAPSITESSDDEYCD